MKPIKGKRPIDCLIAAYLRSPRFAECIHILLDVGADIGDPVLEAVLLDDAAALQAHFAESPAALESRLSPLTDQAQSELQAMRHLRDDRTAQYA